MTPKDSIIETMARAICGSSCEWGPDRIMLGGSGISGHMTQPFERPLWRDFVPDAEAALAALSIASYVVVAVKELESLKRRHLNNDEDPWYGCPKSEDGCSDDRQPKDQCNCGADAHNASVDLMIRAANKEGV